MTTYGVEATRSFLGAIPILVAALAFEHECHRPVPHLVEAGQPTLPQILAQAEFLNSFHRAHARQGERVRRGGAEFEGRDV